MAFYSRDDLMSKITSSGNFWRTDWNKLTYSSTNQTIGEWHLLFQTQGNPTTATLTGATNLSFQSCCDQTTGAIPHGGNVSPSVKHITNASAYGAPVPDVLMLVDLLGFYLLTSSTTIGDQATIHSKTFTVNAGTDIVTHSGYDIASFTRVRVTTTTTLPSPLVAGTDYYTVRQSSSTSKLATSMVNAIAGTTIDITDTGSGTHTVTTYLPRYTTGEGVQCFIVPAVAMGAATPSLRITYTNSTGTDSRLTPNVLPIGKASAQICTIVHSGTAVSGKYNPFIPLQGTDQGIQSIQQLNLSVSYLSGTLCYFLCKPLLTLPLITAYIPSERDLLCQLNSMPRVYDNACLAWLQFAGSATGTNSMFCGHLDFAWGDA